MSVSLTPTQLQNLIVAQVGDPDSVLAPQIALLWTLSALAGRGTMLTFLYTKREAITLLMGSQRTQVTRAEDDLKLNASDYFGHLDAMYAEVQAEIARQEKIARASGGVAVGMLVTTTSDPNPSNDPNSVPAESAVIRGDAYGSRTTADGLPR